MTMSVGQAVTIVDRAQAALPGWSALGPNARRALLNKAADALLERGPTIIEAAMAETGATKAWAGFNLMLAAGIIREAAALTTQITGEIIPSDKPGCLAMAVREPAGVVLGIAPWNAPIILGVRSIATPLACGNTVIFKASEICRRCRISAGCCQPDHQPARGCRADRRRADRPSGGHADQFYRLDGGGEDHRSARRGEFETCAVGTRRQGAVNRAGGCRS